MAPKRVNSKGSTGKGRGALSMGSEETPVLVEKNPGNDCWAHLFCWFLNFWVKPCCFHWYQSATFHYLYSLLAFIVFPALLHHIIFNHSLTSSQSSTVLVDLSFPMRSHLCQLSLISFISDILWVSLIVSDPSMFIKFCFSIFSCMYGYTRLWPPVVGQSRKTSAGDFVDLHQILGS